MLCNKVILMYDRYCHPDFPVCTSFFEDNVDALILPIFMTVDVYENCQFQMKRKRNGIK